jgi:acyl-CoA synthetase (NDP forming)/GNAT superfamily N-acetyltransferase
MNHVLSPTPADVLLADGTVACIRPLDPGDEAEVRALHDGIAEESLRLRFFSPSRKAATDYVDHLIGGTGDTVLSLVAVVGGRVRALATAERIDAGKAEAAFLVSDDAHGRGLGSLLLEHLAIASRRLGVTTFVAEVLHENDAMLRVFIDAGFTMTRTAGDGVVEVELDTAATSAMVRAADDREFHAEAESLHPMLYPRSVAVMGVRRAGGGIGGGVLRSIIEGGFQGQVYVIHPDAVEIAGLKTHRSLVEVPASIDLAVVAVPATAAVDAVRDAAAAGVPAVVVISSGFGELGEDGKRMQRDLLRVARENSIRLVGPNCLGILSNDPSVRLNATFNKVVPPEGGLAIASQSGGVGIAMLDVAGQLGLGVHSFVSLGNKADVSGNDLLAAWYDDPGVSAAALYLESFGNAPKFARIARTFAEHKPLLAVVGGRSSGGVRAGASHTAAAAPPSIGVDALFAQAGVIACHSAEAMARTALLLSQQPLPRGARLGIVSNAGGIGVLVADHADERGLVVPELSAGLQATLGTLVNGTVGTGNPIDLGAGADASHLAGVVEAVLDSGEVDALIVAVVATSVADPVPVAAAVAPARRRAPDVPVVLVTLGGLEMTADQVPGVTVLTSPEHAVEALAQATGYAEWLRQPRTETVPHDEGRAAVAEEVAEDLLGVTALDGGTWLEASEVSRLLAPYGLAPVGEQVTGPDAAAELAERLGYPVVVKVAGRDVVHKTERGLVRVGLASADEVRAAVREFGEELGQNDAPVLVQPVVDGVEIALGVVRDSAFGPLVMLAAGGVATNVWKDRAFLLPPIGEADALRALHALRIWPLLDGFRGSPRADVEGLVRLVLALDAVASDVPEIAELDLNPVLVGPGGPVVVDAKVRLAQAAQLDYGVPRRLRARV